MNPPFVDAPIGITPPQVRSSPLVTVPPLSCRALI